MPDPKSRIRRRLAIIAPKDKEVVAVWDNDWLAKNREAAVTGLAKSKLPGSKEIRFALHPPKPDRGPQELNEAASSSTIETFGWAIGVYLGNREEFRPRPRARQVSGWWPV